MNEHNETYLYNGSFLNLLTLIEYLIKNRIKPLNIKDTNYEATLLDEIINYVQSLQRQVEVQE